MKRKILRSVILCLSILSNTLFAGTIHPLASDNKHVEYAKKFPYIVQLCGTYEDKSLFCASAVVIDKNWILTAAHVVQKSKLCLIHNKDKDKAYSVSEIICHKDFNDNTFGISDIALGYVEQDMLLDFYPELYTDNDEIGKICSISGYGLTGNFKTGAIKSDGFKRAGSNNIDYIDRDLLICSPSSMERTELEFLICSGDSGGGLFIGNKLAGINSCVLARDKNPNSNYSDEGGHTRISKYAPWIKEEMAKKKTIKLKSVFGVDK